MKAKSTKSRGGKAAAEQTIKSIRRATCKVYGAEEKIRIVLEGLHGEARDLKEMVAEQALEMRRLKKSMLADGEYDE